MALYVSRRGPTPAIEMGADGVIAIPGGDQLIVFTKAGVCAATLGAPGPEHNGVRLTFCNATAQANTVVNASPGFNGGGSSFDTETSAGAIGDTFTVEAYNSTWYVVASSGYSLS